MIDILLNGIMLCLTIPDIDEFGMCIDNVVLEYNKKRKKENPDKAKAIRKRARIKHREKQKLKDTLIEKLIEERNYWEGKYRELDKLVMQKFGKKLD